LRGQRGGRVGSRIGDATDASEGGVRAAALGDVARRLAGGVPRKGIVVPGRMVSIVV